MAVLAIAALILGFVLAHVIGARFSRRLVVKPGRIREVMPTLPVAPLLQGRAAARWNQSIDRVEGRLVRHFEGGARTVDGGTVAAEISEDAALVNAALERMREQIPCRLRITASGRLLHDFEAEDIAVLAARRRASWPFKALVFALSALANVGAMWPVLLILMLAVGGLDMVLTAALTAGSQVGELVGLTEIGIILVVAVGVVGLGFLARLALTPLVAAPELGEALEPEALPDRRSNAMTGDASPLFWGWFSTPSSGGGSSSGGGGGGGGSGGSGGGGGGGAGADVGEGIVIVILVAIIVAAAVALFVWFRGLWRAIARRDDELDRVAPGHWVRISKHLDRFERWLPTNDLVGRLARALRRAHAQRRPADADLGARVVALARRGDGRVSTIDIALSEGLDPGEAARVGSRLCGIVGGEIHVSDAGDLVFRLPQSVLQQVNADTDDDLWAEYLDFDGADVMRRSSQEWASVPVNLVGLRSGHLKAGSQLVGGSVLMALTAIFGFLPEARLFGNLAPWLPDGVQVLLAWLAVAFAVGSCCLVAAARYAAARSAVLGVRRDARRAAVYALRGALEADAGSVSLDEVTDNVWGVLQPAFNKLDREVVDKEVVGVVVDFDLEPDPDAGGALTVDLGGLKERIASARADDSDTVLGEPSLPGSIEGGDAIVFDTQIETEPGRLPSGNPGSAT